MVAQAKAKRRHCNELCVVTTDTDADYVRQQFYTDDVSRLLLGASPELAYLNARLLHIESYLGHALASS
jgi:hypothetical protein